MILQRVQEKAFGYNAHRCLKCDTTCHLLGSYVTDTRKTCTQGKHSRHRKHDVLHCLLKHVSSTRPVKRAAGTCAKQCAVSIKSLEASVCVNGPVGGMHYGPCTTLVAPKPGTKKYDALQFLRPQAATNATSNRSTSDVAWHSQIGFQTSSKGCTGNYIYRMNASLIPILMNWSNRKWKRSDLLQMPQTYGELKIFFETDKSLYSQQWRDLHPHDASHQPSAQILKNTAAGLDVLACSAILGLF